MHRRKLVTGLAAATAYAIAPRVGSTQSTPTTEALQVAGEWVFDGVSDPNIGLDAFEVVITAFGTEDDAKSAFDRLFEDVDEGAIYNEETHNETFGEESFFVEFTNLGGLTLVYLGIIRVGILIFQFRWEASHFGGARDGHRLFERVIDRVQIKDTYSETDLLAMFPTQKELAVLGLTDA